MRINKIHYLKIQPEYYQAVTRGIKQFELRKDDRDYRAGDYVVLQEWDGEQYTGRESFQMLIKYVLRDCPEFGLKEGYCILGF